MFVLCVVFLTVASSPCRLLVTARDPLRAVGIRALQVLDPSPPPAHPGPARARVCVVCVAVLCVLHHRRRRRRKLSATLLSLWRLVSSSRPLCWSSSVFVACTCRSFAACLSQRPPRVCAAPARSAFRDRRFQAVTPKDLADMHCTVSLLSCYEQCRTWDDWDIETHGIMIEFSVGGKVRVLTARPSYTSRDQL